MWQNEHDFVYMRHSQQHLQRKMSQKPYSSEINSIDIHIQFVFAHICTFITTKIDSQTISQYIYHLIIVTLAMIIGIICMIEIEISCETFLFGEFDRKSYILKNQ